MKVFKRNAVIITVLVFVCVAVYLNWSYDKKTEDAAKKGEEILNAGSESTDKTETASSAGTISAETSESDNQDEKTAETGLYYAEPDPDAGRPDARRLQAGDPVRRADRHQDDEGQGAAAHARHGGEL